MHYGGDCVKFKTDRGAQNFRIDPFREAVRNRSIRKAAPIDFLQRRVPKFSRFGDYKERDAVVHTRNFDGAGR